jgi:hypothetical protein
MSALLGQWTLFDATTSRKSPAAHFDLVTQPLPPLSELRIVPSPGTIPLLIDCQQSTGDSAMSDEAPPLSYDGLDPAPEPKPTIEKVSEAVRDTAQRVGRAIDAGRKPGMPLSILSNIAREAPLGSLLVAFLLGVVVGRRR